MSSPSVLAPAATATPSALARPSWSRRAVFAALEPLQRGRLRMRLPGGEERLFGEPASASLGELPQGIAAEAIVNIHTEAVFRRAVLHGDIGFAEAYLDGQWTTPDLTAVIAWFIQNVDTAPTLSGSKRRTPWSLNLLRWANRLGHLARPNSLGRAQRNIQEHYDLSNEFFSLFLDPSMMYSSALWRHANQTLEQAQWEKNDALCRSLRLKATDHVLEIGTGWGGWALHAARHYGCRVTTLTLSREQHRLARERIAAAGLDDRVDVRLEDYRHVQGSYDKLVSIEMLEAVGHQFQPEYFRTCAARVKPEGLIALQFITCPDHRYAAFRKGVDFIQKHIFPGSLLLSLNRVNALLSEAGGFCLHEMRDFGPDYARTLRLWRETFEQRLDAVRGLGFDERFIRKWGYYLSYCEAAFALRNISVVHTLHTRPNNLSL